MQTLRSVTLTLGITLAVTSGSQAQSTIIDLGAGSRPESVTRGWGGKMYVSCQNSGASGVLDGQIKTFDLNGNVSVFADGLENPRGLAFTGEYLVVTDTTNLWRIDKRGRKTLIADPSKFPHPVAFMNDAAPDPEGDAVYVTEMGSRTVIRDSAGFLVPTDSQQAWDVPATSRVWRVTMDGQVSEAVTPSRKVLIINGVANNNTGDKLLIAEFFYGNIVVAAKDKPDYQILATGFRGADGIEQAEDGTIYVSSFENGAVWKMDSRGENIKSLLSGVGRHSTADFYLDESIGRLLVADTAHGTIIVLPTN